jgi:hypothetical protein
MAQRGRKSAAALAVLPFQKTAEPVERPAAPDRLPPSQAAEWDAIVQSLPADYFSGANQQLLECMVGHIGTARVLAEVIDRFDVSRLDSELGLYEYDKLTKMAARESGIICLFATKLRLLPWRRPDPPVERPPWARPVP